MERYLVLLETYDDGRLKEVIGVTDVSRRLQADEWIRGDQGLKGIKRYGFEVEKLT